MSDILVIPGEEITASTTSTLSDIVDMFVELSGRNDLIAAGVVADATFFINQGCRELDRRLFGGKAEARYTCDLAASQILVPIPDCRAIKEVWLYTETDKVKLVKADDLDEMKEYYSEPKANKTPSEPYVYFPVNARPYPTTLTVEDYNQQWAFEDIITSLHEGYNAVLISPPPDVATYTLQVVGLFYSDALTEDDDFNYWTVSHPLLLVQAALYKLEQMYRNTEGAKDWNNAIDSTMIQLNSDWIEEEIAEIDQMEG